MSLSIKQYDDIHTEIQYNSEAEYHLKWFRQNINHNGGYEYY